MFMHSLAVSPSLSFLLQLESSSNGKIHLCLLSKKMWERSSRKSWHFWVIFVIVLKKVETFVLTIRFIGKYIDGFVVFFIKKIQFCSASEISFSALLFVLSHNTISCL